MLSLNMTGSNLDRLDPMIFCEFPYLHSEQLIVRNSKSVNAFTMPSGPANNIYFSQTYRMDDDSLLDIIALGDTYIIADLINDPVTISDNIITGSIYIESIDSLMSCDALEYLWISRPMFQSADSARYYSGIYQMNRTGYDGSNVTAALIDNGMILNRNSIINGERDVCVWNQHNNRTVPPSDFSYGEELDHAMLTVYPMDDSTGHGSSLLSLFISADSLGGGMLPQSDIVAVNVLPWEKNVIEGIKYISDKCDDVGASFIICLPMNHFWGRHDGFSPLDRVIDDYFSDMHSGRGISVSSGNLGYANIHFSAVINDTLDSGLLNNEHIIFEKPGNARFDADITDIDSLLMRFIFTDNNVMYNSEWIMTDSSKGGYCEIAGISIRYGFNSKWKHMHITVLNNQQMRFAIEFISSGKQDSISGYIAQGGTILESYSDDQITGDNYNTIAIPGLAKQAITSGAFVSRASVPGINGAGDTIMYIPQWNPVGNYRYIKPDIYAPGKFIITDEINPYSSLFSLPDNKGVYSGTSYAAVITAGAMATVLGTDRLMYTKKLNRLIRTGAGDIPYNPAAGAVIEGYGYLDAYRSFLATRVHVLSSDIIYRVTGNLLYVTISDMYAELLNITKDERYLPIVSNYMALDISPVIGNNIYQITFKKEDRIFMVTDTFVLYESSNNRDNETTDQLYDIAGRSIRTMPEGNGIYFIRNQESETFMKFIYIK